MASPIENKGRGGGNCKTPPTFSREWMGDFVAKAGLSGDVRGALVHAGITLVEYRRARSLDPAFDAACTDVDLAVRGSIQGALELKAADGNVSAAKLLAEGLGRLNPDGPPEPSAGSRLGRWAVGEAMHAEAAGFDPRAQTIECPHCLVAIDVELRAGFVVAVRGLKDWGDGRIHARYGGDFGV